MGASKTERKKGRTKFKFSHFYEYYMNKVGKLKLPNHVKKYMEENQ